MRDIRLSRRTFTGRATTAAAGIDRPKTIFGQSSLPQGPITLVMPFAADGATDIVSRLVAAKASERIGRPIVFGNAGEAGVIGATHVARHSPDGSISPMGTVANHAINSLMARKKPDDPLTDLSPVSLIAAVPNVLLVGPRSKPGPSEQRPQADRSEPRRFCYGSSGIGTPPHLSGELFKAGIDLTYVPYRGEGEIEKWHSSTGRVT
jgi:tripartite-type tricarboxylate transporter receptor subunit TctC